jgi:hypothetical protein
MDLLPKVETEFIEEAPEPLKEEIETDEEDNVKVEIQEAPVPEVEKKPVIPEEDIFVEKKTKKKELTVEPVKKEKKKRVMTEEQLERLRIGREKGLAKRRAAAAEKKELKELQKKKKQKDIQKLREEVSDEPKPKPAPVPAPAPTPKPKFNSIEDLPAELLIKLQQAAIEGYDTKRKARKAKKKEEESKQSELNHFKNMVQNAVEPKQPARYGEQGFFSHLF